MELMSEIGATSCIKGSNLNLMGVNILLGKRKKRRSMHQHHHQHHHQLILTVGRQSQLVTQFEPKLKQQRRLLLIRSQMVNRGSTYSSQITTDIPLYESPEASFDQYLEDKPRVFRAIFPDKRRSQRLNEEEWRIHMLPIDFLFLTVWPVVDMRLRCRSKGQHYPPGVPPHISKVLELDVTRWELQGLDDLVQPSHFNLRVKGALYADREGGCTHLKGSLAMSISVVLPPLLALVPEDVRRTVSESVLKRLVENMEHKVNGSLLADYSQFQRERPVGNFTNTSL